MALILPGRTLDYASPVNWAHPLTRGLVAWWKVLPQRMGSARWLDLTGRSHGTLTGMGASSATSGWGMTTRQGGMGELRFDGTDDFVNVGPVSWLSGAPAFTFACWARQRALPTIAGVFQQEVTGPAYVDLTMSSSGTTTALEMDNAGLYCVARITYAPVGQWFHLAVTFWGGGATNADKVHFYINGAPFAISSFGANTFPSAVSNIASASMNLGRYFSGSAFPWNGALDDVAFWRRALSPTEIDAWYRESRLRHPTLLKWKRPLQVSVPVALPAPEVPTADVPALLQVGRTLDYASPVNWRAPLNRGLVAWWLAVPQRMGGGRWLDLAGRRHGTLTGMLPSSATSGWGTTNRPGGLGEVRLTGSSSRIELGHAFPGLGSVYTVALWMNPATVSGDTTVVSYRSDTSSIPIAFQISLSGTEIYGAFRDDGNVSYFPSLPGSAVAGRWHFVAIRRATAEVSLFLNAQSPATLAASLGAMSVTTMIVGALVSGTSTRQEFFSGRIDDLRVYTRALSNTEIAALYLRSRQRYPQELRWRRPLSVSVPIALPAPEAPTEQAPALLQVGRTLDYASPVNWQHPLNRGLLGWWLTLPQRMGGIRWFDIARRRHGFLNSGLSSATSGVGPTRRPGGLGEIRLNGAAGNYVSLDTMPEVNGATALTIMGWAKQIALDVDGGFFQKRTTNLQMVVIGTWNNGNIYFEMNNGVGNNLHFDYSQVISAGVWFHFAAVFNGAGSGNTGRAQFYVNGLIPPGIAYDGTIPATLPDTTTAVASIGAYAGGVGAGVWNGALDDFQIYTRALSASEVRARYLSSRLRYPTELNWRRPIQVSVPVALPAPEVPTADVPALLQVGRTLDYASPVNWAHPLARGLVSWWRVLPRRLGGARWLDIAGRNHAALPGMGASSATSGWGMTQRQGGDGELRFNGSSSYGRLPAGAFVLNAASSYTWAFMLKPLSFAEWQCIAAFNVTPGSQPLVTLYGHSTNSANFGPVTAGLSFIWSSESNTNCLMLHSLNNVFSLGVWASLVVTYNGSVTQADRVRFWVNGQDVTYTGAIFSAGTLQNIATTIAQLGQDTYAADPYFQGAMDDVAFWRRALSPTEIDAWYWESRLRHPTMLKWKRLLTVNVPVAIPPPAPVVGTPLPAGITIPWAGTAASIPTGWTRVTALDGCYPKGAAAAANPGTTGGATTHTHTIASHSHTTAHVHTTPATTGTGTTASQRDSSNTNPPFLHTHASNPNAPDPATTLTTDSTTVLDSPTTEPPYVEVLMLAADGTATGLPAGALALWADTTALPTGWSLCDGTGGTLDLRGRFLKGAAAAGNGGTLAGSATHSHALPSHTHSTPYAHSHPGVTSSQRSEALTTGTVSGANVAVALATHTHALTFGSTSPAVTGSTDSTTTASNEPPYRTLAIIQNTSGDVSWPDKMLALWSGTIASIPENWALCDGTNGTPDLRDCFIKGAASLGTIGATGGSLTHSHTMAGHSHAVASHSHTVTGAAGLGENRTAGAVDAPITAHTHTWPDTGATSFTSGSATPTVTDGSGIQPPYATVLVLQWRKSAPTLTADPGVLVLTGAATLQLLSMPASAGAVTLTGTATTTRVSMPAASGVQALTGTNAALNRSARFVADAGVQALTGTAATLRVVLPAIATTLALTGVTATLRVTRRMAADAGSLSLAGTATPLRISLAAAAGTLGLIGTATTPRLTMAASAGTLSLTGMATTTQLTLPVSSGGLVLTGMVSTPMVQMPAEVGTLGLTGTDAGLRYAGKTIFAVDAGALLLIGTATIPHVVMAAAAGSLTLSGTATTPDVLLAAQDGTLTLSGSDAALRYARRIVIVTDVGVLGLSGTAVGLRVQMSANAGALGLTGLPLTPDIILATQAGALVLSGPAATLRATHRLVGAPGVLLLTGTDSTLRLVEQLTLAASSGSLDLAGPGATLRLLRRWSVQGGFLTLGGTAATLQQHFHLIAGPGTLVVVAPEADLRLIQHRIMAAAPGSLSLTGTGSTLRLVHRLQAQPGSLLLTSVPTLLRRQARLLPEAGTLIMTGTPASLTLVQAILLQAAAGTLELTGAPVTLHYAAGLQVAPGHLVLQGTLAHFHGPPIRLTRMEYPTEIHFVRPDGTVVRIVQRPTWPRHRWYARFRH